MSDNDDDLFADSDDTAELISSSKPAAKKASASGGGGAKRKRNQGASKKVPDADANDSDDDDDDKGGLFDSDDSDNDDDAAPASKKAKKAAAPSKPMSKRERMEALQKKKRAAAPVVSDVPKEKPRKKPSGGADGAANKESGNQSDSEDSYNSRDFQLTEDDRNFIDTEGDDADAINELYSEQHFDDARGEAEEYNEGGKKKKGRGGGGGGGRRSEDRLENDPGSDNPIMQAVNKMKKKKREARKLSEMEEEAKEFMERMELAAEEDEAAIRERRPATKKLAMLMEVVDTFTKRDMTRVLLDLDVLSVCRRWIQPLSNGQLGNVTIRQRLLDSISNMTGDMGITPNDLKRSEFGKVVMALYMHKSETPAMKRQLKNLIEQWSRPIFQKSGNMRDLERVHNVRGGGGISAYARQKKQEAQMETAALQDSASGKKGSDFDTMMKSGKAKSKSSLNRVRIPYSKGFQFTVRPTGRAPQQSPPDKGGAGRGQEARGNLSKRMMEKSRAVSKNQRSANISIEGRATK